MTQWMRYGVRARGLACGFTLTELLVVLAIMGMLMGLIMGVVSSAKRRAKETELISLISNLSTACEQFKITYNQYPWPPPANDWDAIPTWKMIKEMDPANKLLYTTKTLDDAEKDYTKVSFRINKKKLGFASVTDRYIDTKTDGTFVDLYGEEVLVRLDPTNGMPVIWSKGTNKADDVSGCYNIADKKWDSRNFGDDVTNQ